MRILQSFRIRNLTTSKLSLRLLKYFILIILIMFLLSVYSIEYSSSLNRQNNKTLDHIQTLQLLISTLEKSYIISSNYFSNPIKEYREQLVQTHNSALQYSALLRTLYPNNYLYRDINAMVASYYKDVYTLLDKYAKDSPSFLFNKDKIALDNLRTHIYSYIYQGMSEELTLAKNRINNTDTKLQNNMKSTYFFVGLFTLLCTFTAYKISRSFAKPIRDLSIKCASVARGHRDISLVKIKQEDEINLLIDSFNEMVQSLKVSEKQLAEKHKIEHQLREEQLKNVEMKNLLSLSELEYLLMQINPHFLYNTLNSIAALAIMEDAPKSKEMIDALSGLLRNSLSVLNNTVTLGTEIETIRHYLMIQKVRFGARLQFKITLAPDCIDKTFPAMILQPLVENAIVHGLEEKTETGILEITASKDENHLFLTVSDNGIGISQVQLDQLNALPLDVNYDYRKGIGIPNVRRRLQLLYNENIMCIKSDQNMGTTIMIKLPLS